MPSPRYWREIPARYRLEAAKCKGCGKVVYPARRICPGCRGTAFEPTRLSRSGKIVTATVLHVASDDFAMETPFPVAVIETPEGARLMAQVADAEPDRIVPGTEVTLEFRRVRKEDRSGILCYGYKAVPR